MSPELFRRGDLLVFFALPFAFAPPFPFAFPFPFPFPFPLLLSSSGSSARGLDCRRGTCVRVGGNMGQQFVRMPYIQALDVHCIRNPVLGHKGTPQGAWVRTHPKHKIKNGRGSEVKSLQRYNARVADDTAGMWRSASRNPRRPIFCWLKSDFQSSIAFDLKLGGGSAKEKLAGRLSQPLVSLLTKHKRATSPVAGGALDPRSARTSLSQRFRNQRIIRLSRLHLHAEGENPSRGCGTQTHSVLLQPPTTAGTILPTAMITVTALLSHYTVGSVPVLPSLGGSQTQQQDPDRVQKRPIPRPLPCCL